MKVVLDTNVFVSGLLGGTLSEIISHWRDDDFQLIVSEEIALEYQNVLRRPRLGLDSGDINDVIMFLYRKAEFVSPDTKLEIVLEDESDNRFFEAAAEGGADFIVSGDRHLLKYNGAMGLKVISPRKFLEIIKP
jgi:putative PIN family toxin of toxin-antitoxin system